MNMTNQEIEIKKVICKHCNKCYPATNEFFYTTKGKLKLDKCKYCKKEKAKEYEKNRAPRDRREEHKAYYLKRKMAKQ